MGGKGRRPKKEYFFYSGEIYEIIKKHRVSCCKIYLAPSFPIFDSCLNLNCCVVLVVGLYITCTLFILSIINTRAVAIETCHGNRITDGGTRVLQRILVSYYIQCNT